MPLAAEAPLCALRSLALRSPLSTSGARRLSAQCLASLPLSLEPTREACEKLDHGAAPAGISEASETCVPPPLPFASLRRLAARRLTTALLLARLAWTHAASERCESEVAPRRRYAGPRTRFDSVQPRNEMSTSSRRSPESGGHILMTPYMTARHRVRIRETLGISRTQRGHWMDLPPVLFVPSPRRPPCWPVNQLCGACILQRF